MTVKQKQCLLCYMGTLAPEDIDGLWGGVSAAATARMQQMLGLPDDGVWGPQTETAVLEAVYTYDVDAPAEPDPQPQNAELAARFQGIRYWSPEEFECQCYGKYCDGFPALPDRTLLELVDDIRHKAGRPGHRSSGLRCEIHNRNENGVWNSKHMFGKALDFMIEGMTGAQLLALVQADPRTSYAYIIGNGPYVHVDVE